MGVMNKMRENTAVVLWILVFAFGVIWVLQDSQVFDAIGTNAFRNIAEVDGEPILYEEYSRALDQQLQQYQAQTGESVPPQLMDMYRNQIYDQLIENKLREREMDRLGVQVSDAEVVEMVLGEDPDPFIVQQFGDGNGGINRQLLQSVIDNPDARDSWVQVEEYLRNKRRQEKLGKLIEATVRVSEQEVQDEYIKRNKKVDAEYVALRYADVPDEEVTVSDRDLRDFYNTNKEDFKQERTYDVEYVAFSKQASAQDTTRILDELTALQEGFATSTDDSAFVANNLSTRPYTSSYFGPDELDTEIADAVFSDPTVGRVIGPIQVQNQAHLIKIQDVRRRDDPVLQARHMLVKFNPDDTDAVKAAARQKTQDLKRRIQQGESFANLAREFSEDPGSGARGGDLGWFGKGKMVKPFEEAAYAARIGQVVGPVESQFGYHLIEVQARGDQEVQIADLVQTIEASPQTLNALDERAGDLQYFATESKDFASEVAKHEDLTLENVQVQEGMEVIPGLGQSRAVTNFLATAENGAISDVIELNDRLVVLHVKNITAEGYRSLEEVRAELEPRVILDKKKQMQVQKLQSLLDQGTDFDGLAEAAGVTNRVASGVTFNNTLVPTLGREPNFVGTVLGMEEGEVTGVLEGASSAYVVRMTRLYEPDMNQFEAAKANLEQQLLNQKRQQMRTQWLAELREKSDVIDNRRRFQL